MSTLETTLRIFPRLHAPRSWRLVERNIASSRGAWLVFVSGFFEPLFYLFAMGVGVGALVGTVDVNGQAVGYREFVAPALLAASAMNGAVYESGNVFFKLKYARTYEGVLATPMTVRDVALGELTYTLMRGTVYSIGFVTVMLAMGVLDSPWAILAIPGALLVSAAFAAPAVFGTTLMRSWADFAFIEDLRRRNFTAWRAIDDDTMAGPRLRQAIERDLAALAPFIDYLCAALDLEF